MPLRRSLWNSRDAFKIGSTVDVESIRAQQAMACDKTMTDLLTREEERGKHRS